MPALPSLQVTDPGTQTYAPLSASSPIISHSKQMTYDGGRSSSPASSVSGGSVGVPAQLEIDGRANKADGTTGFEGNPVPNGQGSQSVRGLRSESEETLSPPLGRNGTIRAGSGGKGKGRAVVDPRGHWTYAPDADPRPGAAGDVGVAGSGAREGERVQGMGVRFGGAEFEDGSRAGERYVEKRRGWDEEQGRVEGGYDASGAYPPTNEEVEEERRIQDNLARMAARDQARRRATRTSRMYGSSPHSAPLPADSPDLQPSGSGSGSGFSSATDYRRPLSAMGLGRSNSNGGAGARGAFMGLGSGLGFWKGEKGMERLGEGEETLSREASRQSYNNPYDSQSDSYRPTSTQLYPKSTMPESPPVPSRVMPRHTQPSRGTPTIRPGQSHSARPGTLDRSDPASALSPFADPDETAAAILPQTQGASGGELAGSGSKASTSHQQKQEQAPHDRPVSRVFPGFPDYEHEQRQQRLREATYEAAAAKMDSHSHSRSNSLALGSEAELERLQGHEQGQGQGQGFSYAGAGWKGGAGAGGYMQQHQRQYNGTDGVGHSGASRNRTKERWWHSLCAWGSDLDGGHGGDPDGQGGRTNPYE